MSDPVTELIDYMDKQLRVNGHYSRIERTLLSMLIGYRSENKVQQSDDELRQLLKDLNGEG